MSIMSKYKLCIVRTQNVILELIKCRILSIEEVDRIRAD